MSNLAYVPGSTLMDTNLRVAIRSFDSGSYWLKSYLDIRLPGRE